MKLWALVDIFQHLPPPPELLHKITQVHFIFERNIRLIKQKNKNKKNGIIDEQKKPQRGFFFTSVYN